MKVVCFDLDDTLYKEISYLYEGYRVIAKSLWGKDWKRWFLQMLYWRNEGLDVFERVCREKPDVEKVGLLNMYRYDVHNLILPIVVEKTLSQLKSSGIKLGLITDGREITQMNKISALGLDKLIDDDMMVISESFKSEKPSLANYKYFMEKYPECKDFTYVGDNTAKDFFAPNLLGWNTVCLMDDGRNIHKQNFGLEKMWLPKVKINSLNELT